MYHLYCERVEADPAGVLPSDHSTRLVTQVHPVRSRSDQASVAHDGSGQDLQFVHGSATRIALDWLVPDHGSSSRIDDSYG